MVMPSQAVLTLIAGAMAGFQAGATTTSTYSEEEAIRFAALSAAAYCSTEGWTCGAACSTVPDMTSVKRVDSDELDAHALLGRSGEACVLAFRGTDTFTDWRENIASFRLAEFPGCSHQGQPCKVGSGFLGHYLAIAEDVWAQLSAIGCTKSTPLHLTGHSLGGAIATLALFDLSRLGYNVTKAYTFGQPVVGDGAFAKAFNETVSSTTLLRVEKTEDVIVHISMDNVHHVGTEIYYEGSTTGGYGVCTDEAACPNDKTNAEAVAMLFKCRIPKNCPHLTYLEPAIDFRLDGSSCTRKLESTIIIP